jgi:hypothetical protein
MRQKIQNIRITVTIFHSHISLNALSSDDKLLRSSHVILQIVDRVSNLSRMEGVKDAKKIEKYIKKVKILAIQRHVKKT